MSESPQTRSILVLERSQVPAAHELATDHGVAVEEVPRRGIEPVTTVTLVIMGAAAAVGAVLHLLEQRKGGQVIDLRAGAPKAFYRTPDVVFGMVVIVTLDGRVTVEVKDPEAMFGKLISTLPGLVSGGGSSVKQVAGAVTESFGADVEVETVEIRVSEDGREGP